MSVIEELRNRNRAYAETFDQGDLPVPPAKRVAVVACMDARLDVYRLLGLELGEAHVIRNAGGVVTDDVIRSLVISQRLLGTREIVLVHHTDCGMLTFDEEALQAQIESETGERPGFSFGAFDDLEDDVRESIDRLSECAYLPHRGAIRGFVYQVETGLLREVS